MRGQFNMSKDERYYIYGYAAIGRRIALFLRQNGYQVDGFIDRDAEKLRKESGERIVWLEDTEIDTSCIIIISCQNIATQHQVAEYLNDSGYSKLIFMAAGGNYSIKYVESIRNTWECLNSGILPECLMLPIYEKSDLHIGKDFILQDRGENVVVWIPVELLYSKTKEKAVKELQEKGLLNELNLDMIEDVSDEPIVCSKLLTDFFEFFLNNRGNCKEYIEIYADFARHTAKQHILDRASVIRVWDEELERGLRYFIDAAAPVEWNPKGYFNIIDGTHRSMYLFYRGFTKVPAKLKKEDLQQYLHTDAAKYFSTFPGKFTLPHPLFYQELFSKKERSRLCIALLRYLSRVRWEKDGFLDLEGCDGYLAVSMKHFGVKQVGCLVRDYCVQDMEKGAELVYAKNILYFNAEMWKKLELQTYSAVYVKDTTGSISFEWSAFEHGIIFYDKLQGGEVCQGEVIYSYFDDCGDARDVIAISGR